MSERHAELVQALFSVVQGEIGLVEGCRALMAYAEVLERLAPEEFRTVLGFESETDEAPLGESRAWWSPSALERADRDIAAYVAEEQDSDCGDRVVCICEDSEKCSFLGIIGHRPATQALMNVCIEDFLESRRDTEL